MSAAAAIPGSPSSVRPQHMNAQNTPARSDVPASPRHQSSLPQSHSRSNSTSAAPQLAAVARNDFEQSNLAQVPPSPRHRSDAAPARSDSTRNAASASQSRYHPQDMSSSTSNGAHATPTAASAVRRRTAIDSATGHWDLGKTIGAGSMGKVKLARNKDTGEQVRTFTFLQNSRSVSCILTRRRSQSRSCPVNRPMNTATHKTVKEPTIQRKYAPPVRLLSSLSSTTLTSAACATSSAQTTTGTCCLNLSTVARCSTTLFPMAV
jgi:hypothetical protein